MKRSVYLEMKPLAEAREIFLSAFDWIALAGTERIPTAEALGRVIAGPAFAALSSPSYHGAAMDGFAVSAPDTYPASEERPVRLAIGSGAHPVNTGQPMPAGSDAVVMIEHVQMPDAGSIEITAAAYPWQHVRRVGEDIVAGEMLLPHHHLLGAADVAALLTAGVYRIEVLRRPRVAVIATGSELMGWAEAEERAPGPGRIVDTNSVLLAGLVEEAGGVPVVLARQPDRADEIRKAVEKALESDVHMVIVNAGASAGSEDHTVHVFRDLGEVLVHGIATMPGKPTVLGKARGKPLVGAPGYPVSAWVCFDQIVRPALALMQALEVPERETVTATPSRPLPSKLGQEEFLRVHLGRVGGKVVAAPLKRGAGMITSLTRADGILRIPAATEGLDEGAPVEAELLHPARALERTLVVVGSHDSTLDILADHVSRRAPGVGMSASHVGSLAGLVALREGRSHMGGTHLLDTETGEYNVTYVRKHLAGVPVRLVTLALREQGLMVRRGNPDRVRSLEDIGRGDVMFVNRQAGSGTRVLLDYNLARLGIDPARIRGYSHEEYTHMAVGVAVLSGVAHAGLGIRAAANALGLDFVPVATERYDLCIPVAYLDDLRVRALLDTLASPEFRAAVEALGGYDVSPMGKVAWEG